MATQSVFSASNTLAYVSTLKHHTRHASFCPQREGWGPFSSATWDFTPCFESLLDNVPAILLLVLMAPLAYRNLLGRQVDDTPKDWHFWAKIIGVIGVASTCLTSLVIQIHLSYDPVADVRVWSHVINLLALGIAGFLHWLEQQRSRVSGTALIVFWTMKSLIDIIRLRSLVERGLPLSGHSDESFLFIPQVIEIVLTWLVWILQSFIAKANAYDSADDKRCPVETANILSRATFQWLTPLMRYGHKHYLTADDMTELRRSEQCSIVIERFETAWETQKYRGPWALWKTMLKTEGMIYLFAALCKGGQDILSFVQPQLLRMLLTFINSQSSNEPEPRVKGFAIAAGMLLVSVVQTLLLHQYFQVALETGMRIRSALTAKIYRKALLLNSEGRALKTTGDIVNLMSVDTQRVADLTQYGQIAWSGPFQIILCLVSLYQLVGWAMLAGIAIMIIMIPINAWVSNVMKKNQKAQMANKDARTRLMAEILNNIKTIKLYAWEKTFLQRLFQVRNERELKMLKKIGVLQATFNFTWSTAPMLVSCSTFAVYALVTKRPLTTDVVFPALTLFNLLAFPLAVLPNVLTSIVEATVAVERLVSFFNASELQTDAVDRSEAAVRPGADTVVVEGAEFAWSSTGPPTLRNIDFCGRKGQLTCIVGTVGSGKSSLLQACLGELHKRSGKVAVSGKVAYVAQNPWIMNASVRQNILFGHRFDPQFYEATISACALKDDLKALPDGDETEVGEKGISLSGGQKARLSLARAVYCRADVYFLDDPLSAVDQHVGKHLVENVFGPHGLLKSKTRVLATNYVPVLSQADMILLLRDRRISERGTYEDVMTGADSELKKLITEFGKKAQDREDELSGDDAQTVVPASSDAASSSSDSDRVLAKRRESSSTLRRASEASFRKPHGKILDEEQQDPKVSAVAEEFQEKGNVKLLVYKRYAQACSYIGIFFLILFVFLSQAAQVWSSIWLKDISSSFDRGDASNPALLLGVYFLLGVASSGLTMCYVVILWVFCSIRASRTLHEDMANAVFRAPMTFFETTPMGRILNRFSNDVYKIDEVLARTWSMFLRNSMQVMFVLGVICATTPAFAIVILPMAGVYYFVQRYYLTAARELKRLDSTSRSPIYAHFQESLGGMSTIRAYDQEGRFARENEWRVDMNQKPYFLYISTNRWLAVRLEFIGSILIFAAAFFAVVSVYTGGISAGLVGLSMSYALNITQSLNWIVRQTVEVETNIVSVERALEYAALKSEAASETSFRTPASWPSAGEVSFIKYSTRYREGLPDVLKQIDVKIGARQKVGIVGRTGAGKSSLTLALFRVIEAASGRIEIDGIDTSKLGLHELRSKLSIIPQDAQAFEGTVRENLDPPAEHDDTDMYSALRRVQLIPEDDGSSDDETNASNIFRSLDSPVGEGGSNMSAGQRQLMTLARGLLRRSKVVIMDEATSSIDFATDKQIQKILTTEFKEATVLTIAHRLSTVIDYDKILVLDYGKVKEFDTPKNLLRDPNSLFSKLCETSGELDNFRKHLSIE
ncbi:ATP-binding cassette glutathione S-conjugate transporter ycf1 [Savitreella phatthalungensis]